MLISILKLKFFCSVYLSYTQICIVSATDQILIHFLVIRSIRFLVFATDLMLCKVTIAKVSASDAKTNNTVWYKSPVLEPFLSRWVKILRALLWIEEQGLHLFFLPFCLVFMLWNVAIGKPLDWSEYAVLVSVSPCQITLRDETNFLLVLPWHSDLQLFFFSFLARLNSQALYTNKQTEIPKEKKRRKKAPAGWHSPVSSISWWRIQRRCCCCSGSRTRRCSAAPAASAGLFPGAGPCRASCPEAKDSVGQESGTTSRSRKKMVSNDRWPT